MAKLKPKVKEEWVKDLESGKFKQMTGKLKSRTGNSRCCLGVLCETKKRISHKKVWDVEISSYRGLLNQELLNWSGLNSETQYKLINFNDSGKSFKWIAAYIKRYL